MKSSLIFMIMILICAILLSGRPFIVAGDEDEPPYGHVDSSGTFRGIYVDVL